MVASGNDHLNDRNHCNWAAKEDYSRFQIDEERSGVRLSSERCVGFSENRRRWCGEQEYQQKIRIIDALHCSSSSHLSPLFLPCSSWLSHSFSSSISSLPLLTPLSALSCYAFCFPHVPPPPPPPLPPPHSNLLWLLSTTVWTADRSRERQEQSYAKKDECAVCVGGIRVVTGSLFVWSELVSSPMQLRAPLSRNRAKCRHLNVCVSSQTVYDWYLCVCSSLYVWQFGKQV